MDKEMLFELSELIGSEQFQGVRGDFLSYLKGESYSLGEASKLLDEIMKRLVK